MKIYETLISDHENDDEMRVENIAVLETDEEIALHDDENYEELFGDSDFNDDDIFFYIKPDDIPVDNEGEIQEGDTYDFFTIEEIYGEL
jgi:hypothetical protein